MYFHVYMEIVSILMGMYKFLPSQIIVRPMLFVTSAFLNIGKYLSYQPISASGVKRNKMQIMSKKRRVKRPESRKKLAV